MRLQNSIRGRKASGAYSLVELIAVTGIVLLMVSMAVPTVLDLLKSMRMNHAAEMLQARLMEARAMAVTHNRDIEVRVYKNGADARMDLASGHGMQIFRLNAEAGQGLGQEAGALRMIPEGVEDKLPLSVQFSLNAEFTSFWKLPLQKELSAKGPREYVAFRYRPDGSTDLAEDQKWTLSLVAQPEEDASRLPANFVVFMLDPVTGYIRRFRPE